MNYPRRPPHLFLVLVLVSMGILHAETFGSTEKAGDTRYALVHTLPRTVGYVNGMACSRDGSLLAIANDDGQVTLWNTESGTLMRVLKEGEGAVYAVAISPDGTTLATAGFDGMIRLWAALSGRVLQIFTGHQGWINSVAFTSDGRMLISGGRDRTLRVWEITSGKTLQVVEYPSEVFTVAADHDGAFFASDKGNSFSLRDSKTGREVAGGAPGQWGINTLVFSPRRPLLISSGYDGFLWVWNIADAKVERRVEIGGSPIISLATIGDGKALAVLCTGSGIVALYDTASWHEEARLQGVTYPIGSVVMSEDGRILAAGGGDSPVRIWHRSAAR